MHTDIRQLAKLHLRPTLIGTLGLGEDAPKNCGQSAFACYRSKVTVVSLELYRREIYVHLHRTGDQDRQASLFNLNRFLAGSASATATPQFYTEEKDESVCYRKQLIHIARSLELNFQAIERFFASDTFDAHFAKLNAFVTSEYPDLFRTTDS